MDNQQPSTKTYIMNKKPKNNNGFIYKYTSPSGKSYIGITERNLFSRAKTKNGKGYKNCTVFYKAIQKYGFENFKVEILEECPIPFLKIKEVEYIEFYNTQIPYGYNVTEGGDGHSKRVFQYDCKTGKFLNEFSSLTAAAIASNRTIEVISNCANGRTKTGGGFIWSFEKFEQVNPEAWNCVKPKKVYCYSLNGEFIKEYESITAAAIAVQGNRSDIKKCINGKIKYSKGFIWKDKKYNTVESVYTGKNGAKPIKQFDLKTNKLIQIYDSASEAARTLGLNNSSGINKACNGKQKSCAGFRWEFCEGSTTKDS